MARQKGRKEIHLVDLRMTMCLLLTIMVDKNQLTIASTFNNALRDEWLRRYPKQTFQLTNYDTIVGGFKRRLLCFITTAACEFAGKAGAPGGQAQIEEYYNIAPGIVTAIALRGEAQIVYPRLWKDYLLPCYEDLLRGDNAGCRARYTDMVRTLSRTYGLS